ncbi:conserved hypothetical protein [Ricinus communis]|uniref:Spore coat protein U/FanG domain-containing protein n=1 Tax=Ricinus communis TaxID=3988 RepID=B9TD65_RICCO|nr:conserved hypothetical protein [Ricinus communis]
MVGRSSRMASISQTGSVTVTCTPGSTVAGTGTGNAQLLTIYGRVPPQTTPSSGTYTDTVVVTLTY